MSDTAKHFKELSESQRSSGESRTMLVPPPATGRARGTRWSVAKRTVRFFLRGIDNAWLFLAGVVTVAVLVIATAYLT